MMPRTTEKTQCMKASLQVANDSVVETVRLPCFRPEHNRYSFTEVVQLAETVQKTNYCIYNTMNGDNWHSIWPSAWISWHNIRQRDFTANCYSEINILWSLCAHLLLWSISRYVTWWPHDLDLWAFNCASSRYVYFVDATVPSSMNIAWPSVNQLWHTSCMDFMMPGWHWPSIFWL